jgi:hypothetical protein
MTDRRNTDGKWTINHSWTQPYPSMNSFYQMNRLVDLQEQLRIIEMVDNWVDAMLTYPDAEAILKKIK